LRDFTDNNPHPNMTPNFLKKTARLLNPEHLFDSWSSEMGKLIPDFDGVDYQPFIENVLLLDELGNQPNLFIGVWAVKTANLVWFSQNYEEFFGYPKAEFLEKGMRLAFKGIAAVHKMYFFQLITNYMQFFLYSNEKQRRENISIQHCGIIALNPKTGEKDTYFMRQHCIKYNDAGQPALFLCIIEKVDHLIKGDRYWIRYEAGKSDKNFAHFHSDELLLTKGDLLTAREMEILRLVNDGLESDAIAEKLFISIHTVDKHRKNMLQKMDAKNSTAMLHMAKLCRMI
jgi:DNA-binding CsgD family transcriptional regulator